VSEKPTTQQLRLSQLRREQAERERAEKGVSPADTGTHTRRADKATYLREKLEQRAEAERRAAGEDAPDD
jgi:hypothetical protein